jgi:maltose O-acetyltransferase
MRERMLAGDLYIAEDPEIFEAANASLDLMAAYNATSPRSPSATTSRSGRTCSC